MATNNSFAIFWFRQDLRINDNPGLIKSLQHANVLPVYILDDLNSGEFKMGAASRWWLHNSLISLKTSLKNNLSLYIGDPFEILKELSIRFDIDSIFWNRSYEPWRIKRDKMIKSKFLDEGINIETFNASLLWEPWDILKSDGTPYKVFTPFFKRGCLNAPEPRKPLAAPKLKS